MTRMCFNKKFKTHKPENTETNNIFINIKKQTKLCKKKTKELNACE